MIRARLLLALILLGACGASGSSPREDNTAKPNEIPTPNRPSEVSAELQTGEEPIGLTDSLEFSLPQVASGTDSSDVRARLGAPDSTDSEVTGDPRTSFTYWHYHGLRLELDHRGKLKAALIWDRAWQTRRGLRIGDSSARMHALYGVPLRNDTESYNVYQWKHASTLILGVVDADGVVSSLFLGWND